MMKRILFSLLFALLALSASAQSDSINDDEQSTFRRYRGDASVGVSFLFGAFFTDIETTHGIVLDRRDCWFVGAGAKWLPMSSGDFHGKLYVRGKYTVPTRRMKVRPMVSVDVGLYTEKYTYREYFESGFDVAADVGLAIRMTQYSKFNISLGVLQLARGEFMPHLKLGFSF